ncbi:MAG: zinc-ribbon domain-containing protein [Acutalibacteraceae bacterium]
MALINCPECGEKISDKSKQCIHCGFPICTSTELSNNIFEYNGKTFDLSKYKYEICAFKENEMIMSKNKKYEYLVNKFAQNIFCGEDKIESQVKAIDIIEYINKKKSVPESYDIAYAFYKHELSRTNNEVEEKKNHIQCPKCASTNVTTSARGVNAFWGIIGASETVNRCANCGYTWNPENR